MSFGAYMCRPLKSTPAAAGPPSSQAPEPLDLRPPECERCGRAGHEGAACPSFSQPRLEHSDATSRGVGPHMFQISVSRRGDCFVVEGNTYSLGRASGQGNNCLIDTLRQALGLAGISLEGVRETLKAQFTRGPSKVEDANYLELGYHWAAIVDALKGADASRRYRVLCITPDAPENGEVAGSGRTRLFIARTGLKGSLHFVPLVREDPCNQLCRELTKRRLRLKA